MHLNNNALLVEGGGMRGTFSTGVLDAFLHNNFNPFRFGIGVSSGAVNLACYLSKQFGRNQEIYCDYSLRKEFIDFIRFFKGGDLLDIRWLWDIVEKEYPLDQQQLFNNQTEFYLVMTHMLTGKAQYLKPEYHNIIDSLMASSAIPRVTRPVLIEDQYYVDGGVADALPIEWAYNKGIDNLVIIRTRAYDYNKISDRGDHIFSSLYLRDHSQLADALRNRSSRYQHSIDLLRNKLPGDNVRVIEVNPPNSNKIAGIFTTNKAKLKYTYDCGFEAGLKAMEQWNKPQ